MEFKVLKQNLNRDVTFIEINGAVFMVQNGYLVWYDPYRNVESFARVTTLVEPIVSSKDWENIQKQVYKHEKDIKNVLARYIR